MKKYSDKKAIFIIGSPRSGTTWLVRLFHLHPQLKMASTDALGLPGEREESDFFKFFIKEMTFKTEQSKLSYVRKKYWSILEERHVAFFDKTPDHAFEVEEIVKCFPDCYFLHTIRNGLDVTASMKEFKYLESKNYAPWGDSRPDNWRKEEDYLDFRLKFSDINKWRNNTMGALKAANLSPNYYEIRYEDLLDSTVDTLSKYFNFLGVDDISEDIVSRYLPNNPSHLGKNPLIKVAGQKNRWKDVLSSQEYYTFLKYSKTLMEELGYSTT